VRKEGEEDNAPTTQQRGVPERKVSFAIRERVVLAEKKRLVDN